uniref:Potential DNA-binding domain-containing protein n=1 Tax=Ditylenchus dipsaci TaxID=166011 RepID=A0A915ELH8_9BILA
MLSTTAVAVSINSPSSTSNSITTTTNTTTSTSSKAQDIQTTSLITPSTAETSEETAEDRGFTIVVPANVRFRGVNMQLDLKLDQKTLAAASDISRAVEEAVTSASMHHHHPGVEGSSSSNLASRQQTIVRIPSSDASHLNFSMTEAGDKGNRLAIGTSPSTPLLMDSTVGEGSANEESKSFQSVSSTTNEGLDTRNGLEIKSPANKNFNMPTSSSQPFLLNDLNTVNDTTVSTSMRIATEEATSTSNKQADDSLEDQQRPLLSSQSSTYEQRDDNQSIANTSHEDVSFHDIQPCSSSTQNAAFESSASKKKRDRTTHPNYCGFFDKDKGQCKQRAILSFKYCIRHILLDSEAPYKQCQFKRKPKNKKDEHLLCTNAIRANKPEIYCSTHLIMKGMLQPKKKGGAANNAKEVEQPMQQQQQQHSKHPEGNMDFQAADGYSQSSFMDTSPYDLRPMSFGGNSYAGDNWDQASNKTMSGGPNTPSLNPPSRGSGYQQPPQSNGQYHGHHQSPFDQHHHQEQQRNMQMPPASQNMQEYGGYAEQRVWSNGPASVNNASGQQQQSQHRPPPPFENERYPPSPFMPNNNSTSSQKQQHLHSSFNTSFSPVDHNNQADFLHPMPSPVHHQHQQNTPLRPPSSNQNHNTSRYPNGPPFQGNIPPPSKMIPSNYIQGGPPPQPKQQQIHQQNQQSSQSISRLSKQHPQLAAKLLQPPTKQGDGNRPQSGQSDQIYRPHPPFQNFPNGPQRSVALGDRQLENRPVENSGVRTNYMPHSQQQHQQVMAHVNGGVHMAEFAGNAQQQSIFVPIQNLPPSSQFHFIDIMPISSSPLAFLNSEPPPVKYNIEALEDSDSLDEELKIRRDYLTDDGTHQKAQKNIKLRQKRQKVKIQGAFRAIPLVDSMCKIVENHDFDSTDLFLWVNICLEPSDDESSSDDGFPAFGNETYSQFLSPPSNRIELYLLKKQLRLESSRLVQRAKLSVPIIQASKQYKTCVGASLRARQMNRRREATTGIRFERDKIISQ